MGLTGCASAVTSFGNSTTGAVTPPAIIVGGPATGTQGAAFAYQITATNAPTSFGASGLPAGATVNTASGMISGTPTAAGSYSVILMLRTA